MSNEQRALAIAKMAAKRGTATDAQKALLAKVEAKAMAAKAEAEAARSEKAKRDAEWAKANAAEIERVRKENANWHYDETFKMYYTIVNGKKQWA